MGPVRVTPPDMRGLIGLRTAIGNPKAFSVLQETFDKKTQTFNRTTKITPSAGYVYDSVLMAAKGIQNALKENIQLSISGSSSPGICLSNEPSKKKTNGLYDMIKKKELMGPVRVTPPDMRGLIGLRTAIGNPKAFSVLQETFDKKTQTFNRTTKITPSAGYVYDSVLMAAKGIQNALKENIQLSISGSSSPGICLSNEPSKKKTNGLYDMIKKATSKDGVMNSDLKFEETGEPRSATYDVVNVRTSGSVKFSTQVSLLSTITAVARIEGEKGLYSI
ncbi:hypothetical protein AC249_AIPGENE11095 [Exaiptasia diaphana]|nr:hypothetical protein AC249_AIPGENE11095 [Exaiptasia diaphana]